MLEFGVLGYLSVRADGLDIDIRGDRRRAVLVRLLMAGGHPLSSVALAEDAWDGDPPKAAIATLQSHVAFLRKNIPGLAVPYVSGGYVLKFGDATLDSRAFEADLQEAQAHQGDLGRMEALLARALGRWRGPALADVAGASWAQGDSTRLEQLRLGALEAWLMALIETGRTGQAVAEAEAAVETNPLSDGLWAALMVGLYRSGRQAEAMRAYQRVRDLLAESGFEPSARLTEIEGAIARDDPDLPGGGAPSSAPITVGLPAAAIGDPERTHPEPSEPKSNLPSEISSFVGREAELAEVRDLLASSRLVTITGAGGLGKTRLSVQAAAELAPDFDNGVWFIDLAPLSSPEHVPSALAQVFGVREEPDTPIVATVLDALRTRRALIVFDNCEHLIESSAQLVEALIRSCPEVSVLASSRERLDIRGERVFRIPPLSLPAPDAAGTIRNSEAVQLFVERAKEGSLDLELSPKNKELIASICWQLDGMPLAIELAAARLRSFTIADIERRLRDRFKLLTGGSRTAAARQRTLSATVQWSYDLLNDAERWMLCRLSVFRGGWDLEAAEVLCESLRGDSPLDDDVIDVLSSLVDKSLIYTEVTALDSIRYRILETIRGYAANRLEAEGDGAVEAVRIAHAKSMFRVVEEGAPHLSGPQQAPWLARFELEHENLRAAFTFCLEHEPVADPAVGLTIGLRAYWTMKGYYLEATTALEALLESDALRKPNLDRARALVASGALNHAAPKAAMARLEEGRALAKKLKDARLLADALCEMAWIEFNDGNTEAGITLATEGLAAAEHAVDLNLKGLALSLRASLEFPADQDAGRVDFDRAIECFTAVGNADRLSGTWCRRAIDELEHGDREAAKVHLDRVLQISGEIGNDRLLPFVWAALGLCAMLDQDAGLARTRFTQCLTNALRVDDRRVIAYASFGLAYSATARGDAEAATLYGIADRLLEEYDEKLEPPEAAQRADDRSVLTSQLGQTEFEAACRAGNSLDPNAAIAFVRTYSAAVKD